MAGQGRQKLKILFLERILETQTDEKHPMTVAEMITELGKLGIQAERKSIYDDLETLRCAGMDIVTVKGRGSGYYVGARRFELAELKLLADIVQSSQFLTQRKTDGLVRKIESLSSVHEARNLRRQVYVRGRIKAMNESVYYNVDELSHAIEADRVIHFQYLTYSLNREQRLRRDGQIYEVSPYALIWDRDRYYLLGWEQSSGLFKHFRVDKIVNIVVLNRERSGKTEFEQLNLSDYSHSFFGMYSGDRRLVWIRFANSLVGPVIDRFGRDIPLLVEDEEHFSVGVEVVSPQFYAWLFAYGEDAEILEPSDVREEMKRRLRATADKYENSKDE